MGAVIFERDALRHAVAVAGKVQPWQANEKSPALFRIVVRPEVATIVSTDVSVQIEADVPCEAEHGTRSLVVPAANFSAWVERAPQGARVVLSALEDGAGTTAAAGRSRVTMAGRSSQALPIREINDAPAPLMKATAFRDGLLAAVPATMDSYAQPYLGGVWIEPRGERLTFAAQDGNRVHAASQDGARVERAVLLPRKSARLIASLIDDEADYVAVQIDKRSIRVGYRGIRVMSALVDARFPSVDQQLASPTNRELRCKASALLADLDLIATVSLFRDRDFRLDLGEVCEASAFRIVPELAAGAVRLEATFTGAPIAIGFQFPLVRDALELFGDAEIVWRMGGPHDPTTISSPAFPGMEAMISPFLLAADHLREVA